ncbi:MAG: hypothetical protein L0214_01725 [candidate division NC10 bacterium]|nr:hypothetical protein [candidate division NC10 bacterium]
MTSLRESPPRLSAPSRATVLLLAVLLAALAAGAPPSALSPVDNQVREIRERPLLAHTVSGLQVNSGLPLYEFLLSRPDITAALARAVGAAGYRVSPDGEDGYRGEDGKGAKGHFMLVERGEGRRVYFARGTYDKPLLPTIAGRIVLVLEYKTNGPADPRVENRVQGFVRIDTPIVGTLARIGRPLVKRAMDKKVRHLFDKIARLLDASSADPSEALRRLAEDGPRSPQDLETLRQLLEAERSRRAAASS